MNSPVITSYQFDVLCQTAQATVPILLMAHARHEDKPSLQRELLEKHSAVEELVVLGLAEDVSDEFVDTIRDHAQRTGRRFSVYGLTENGYLLFKDCEVRTTN